MSRNIYRAALFYLLLLTIDGKKTRRIKTTQPEDQDSSPQPSVVSYSTFGFNDVGSYDGFVPSSPDYATYLSSNVNHQDSTPPRLYAPAFPSASETSGFGNIGTQHQDGQAFSSGDDNSAQPSVLQYNSAPYFNPDNDQSQNSSPEEKYRRIVDEESNSPVYGTKLGGKNKHKLLSQFNDTAAFDVYSNGNSNPSETISRYPHFKETETTHEAKPVSYGESASSHQNIYNYAPTYPPTEADEVKPSSNNTYSFNFPKVIDFTKYKQYYPTEVENKFPMATFQPVTNRPKDVKDSSNYDSHKSNNYDSQNNNNYDSHHGISNNYGSHGSNNYDLHNNNKNYESHSSLNYPSQAFKNTYEVKEENQESDIPKPAYTHHSYSNNFVSFTSPKSSLKDTKPDFDYKDKMKHTPPWVSSGHNSSIKNWRSPVKGYEYSTDFSNMSFKYDTSVPEKEKHSRRKPFSSHTDELTPASSNVVDLPDYKFPELDYSSFKKIPGVKAHYDDDYYSLQSKYKDLFKSDDYINQFKNLYSSNAPSTSSLWGNVYKGPEFTSLKHPSVNSHYSDEITNDIVHIPKSKQKTKFSNNKYSDTKPSEWSFQNKYRPHKTAKPNDWTKDVPLTRFKSEEDLLGLRTHDTSHPSYLPSYRPFNDVSDEFDYKKLVEKWRQSYLKSKYKDSFRDFETYASDAKPIHVPIPKPYAIEVPRPVIVPVPEPYPVRVPIPRPVAVPVVRELKVQIEKPVPYPVYKNVPYPVEKPVPVPVEKQVPVPVMKPYPVAVPHIRPVFHHTRPHDELDAAGTDEDDDYLPRPEGYRTSKKVPYSKRPKSPRYRPRRPQRPTYHERNRRQWPVRRPTRRPSERHPSPFRSPYDEDEYERSDYYLHCKRTGHC